MDHDLTLTPQVVSDGWEAKCSCGNWRAFKSFYDIPAKDDLIEALRAEHRSHVEAGQSVPKPLDR